MDANDKSGSLPHDTIMQALQRVQATELGGDIVTLGMVRSVNMADTKVTITLLSPTPEYPFQAEIIQKSQEALRALGVTMSVDMKMDTKVQGDARIAAKLNMPIKHIVAVASGKGGVGKSTVAVNLAVSLAAEGLRVGLMDADIYGPNIPMMMGVAAMPPVQAGKLIPAEAHGVKFMSMGFLVPEGKALIWRGPMLHKAIQQLFVDVRWGELDYLIIDLPPGTGDAQLSLAQTAPLSGGVIVTMPQDVSLSDARRGAAAFQQLEVPILGVIENMSGAIFGTGGGERAARELDVPFLGSVELDAAVRVGGDLGEPIVIANPTSPAAQSLVRLARLVALRLNQYTVSTAPTIKLI